MDLSAEEMDAQIKDAFARLRKLPEGSEFDFTLQEERDNRNEQAYATYALSENDQTGKAYSLLVPPEHHLKFSSQVEVVDGDRPIAGPCHLTVHVAIWKNKPKSKRTQGSRWLSGWTRSAQKAPK